MRLGLYLCLHHWLLDNGWDGLWLCLRFCDLLGYCLWFGYGLCVGEGRGHVTFNG